MRKVLTVALREFRATALTGAFLFGAVILPAVIWAAMIGVSAMRFERPALEGTLAIADRTQNGALLSALTERFEPEAAEARAKLEREMLVRLAQEQAKAWGASPAGVERGMSMGAAMVGVGQVPRVGIEAVAESDEAAQRERAKRGEVLAFVTVTESSLSLAVPGEETTGESRPGHYEFVQGETLRPQHATELRREVERAIQDERYRRAGIDPIAVRAISGSQISAQSVVVTERGEKKSNEVLVRILPFIFLMLIYIAAITGGQYLMMGTLEEKGTRVMEVILSACSTRELLVGKLIGQGMVGLALMAVYGGVGLAAANQFGVLTQVPTGIIPWVIIYFVMAYAFLGAMMLAVGSAVTEIREAQALYTPITFAIILPFLLMFPLTENPGSWIATAASFFPPTTPFAMVMRLSQPSYTVPLWELIGTTIVGFIGVAVVVWAAAKIFRVGVLMYGKPPSLMGLLKWIRHA